MTPAAWCITEGRGEIGSDNGNDNDNDNDVVTGRSNVYESVE
jgi:hypothetical protein